MIPTIRKSEGSSDVFFARRDEIMNVSSNRRNSGETRDFFVIRVPKKWVSSKYIALFNKTPPDIVCPQFWELKWAYGCPFSCSYCYLQGTLFGKKDFKVKDFNGLKKELRAFLSWATEVGLRILLNAGELCDTLGSIDVTPFFCNTIIEVLQEFPEHRVLIVTKGGVRHTECFIEASKNFEHFFIVSYSINAEEVAKRFEKAPTPRDRLMAAKMVQDHGYILRLRIDPLIPIEEWEKHYSELIDLIFSKYELHPERITIGSLRGLAKTIRFSKDRAWIAYVHRGEKTGWGLKPRYEIRKAMYILVLEKLKEYGYKLGIALCKETYEMWSNLYKEGYIYDPGEPGIWQNVKCNCKL